jgi:hypothetical protein
VTRICSVSGPQAEPWVFYAWAALTSIEGSFIFPSNFVLLSLVMGRPSRCDMDGPLLTGEDTKQ